MPDVFRGGGAIQVAPVDARRWLRVKSWGPLPAADGGPGTGDVPLSVAGQALPRDVGAVASGPVHVLCLGPGEWLVRVPLHSVPALHAQIVSQASAQGLAVVELSDGLAGFEVAGPAARELLSKGCGLDLHPRSFPAGRCARTRFAQIPVAIECAGDPQRFELHVAASHGPYLHEWIADAAVEFGGAAT